MSEILEARDLPDFDEEVQVLARIYDAVWVAVEEKLEDGSVVVNRVTGECLEGKSAVTSRSKQLKESSMAFL